MACEQYQAQFTDFLENTLPEVQWRELEWHLRQCATCAADIKHFRQTVGALHALQAVAPSRHLSRAISARLASLTPGDVPAPEPVVAPAPVRVRPARPRPVFRWGVAGSLAGACLALVAITFFGLHGLRPAGELLPAGPAASSAPAASEGAVTSEAAASGASGAAASATPGTLVGSASPSAPAAKAAASGGSAPPATPAAPAPAPSVPATFKSANYTPPPPQQARVAFGPTSATPRPRAVGVDIKVDPPSDHTVDTWGTVGISIVPEGAVPHALVRVVGGDGLEVRGGSPAYAGPLAGNASRHISVQVRARRSGDLSLRVIVNSDTPVVDTDLSVRLSGYHSAVRAGQTRRQFHSVSLAEAAQQVAADGGVSVSVAPQLAGRRITADFSAGVSVSAALRVLAQMADGRLDRSGGEYRLVTP